MPCWKNRCYWPLYNKQNSASRHWFWRATSFKRDEWLFQDDVKISQTIYFAFHGRTVSLFWELNPWLGFMNIQRKGYKLARLFSLCQPRLPGQWISMCISMRLTNDTQEIKVGQNGQICYERLFSDEQFDRLNYKNYNIMEGW